MFLQSAAAPLELSLVQLLLVLANNEVFLIGLDATKKLCARAELLDLVTFDGDKKPNLAGIIGKTAQNH
jgi:hypothetical protein